MWTALLCVAMAGLNLGDVAMATGQDRYVGVELGGEGGSPLPPAPVYKAHGILRARWIENALIPGPGGIDLDLNTDTLALGYHHPDLFGPGTWTRVYARAQAFAANLLSDHARGGMQRPERAFGAGYLLGGGYVGASPLRTSSAFAHFGAQLEARQWFHFALPGGTADDLALPPWNQALEPGLFALLDVGKVRTRLYRRHGMRTWFSATGIGRLGMQPWGQLGDDDDGRNAPGPFGARAEVGVEGGFVSPMFYGMRPLFGVEGRGGLGWGLDDRDRFRVGGDNPWVVPLAGAGWAEFLADNYAWGTVKLGLSIFDYVVLEGGGDLAVVTDPGRNGSKDVTGFFSGLYLGVEARPIDDVIIRFRSARGFGLPRPQGDSFKVFANVEWRILPWSWW